jgi:threonine/homoserine/homoserine lactone efflux protein
MTVLASIVAILGALLIGAISPGPSFVVVAQMSIGGSRRIGLLAAIGMGVGATVFAGLALGGLYTVLATVEWLYVLLKIAGGGYLLFLAVRIWRSARQELVVASAVRHRSSNPFVIGLTTQLSNPKTAVVYGSIFASLLPGDLPLWGYVLLPMLVLVVEAGWYSLVAFTFSSARPRGYYVRSKKWIDRAASGVIAVLGVRLIATAGESGA